MLSEGTSTAPVYFGLIEDDPYWRDTLIKHFSKSANFHCRIAVPSFDKFQQIFRADMGLSLLIVDIYLPYQSGIEALPALKKLLPDAELVMYTVSNESDHIFNALRRGATGFVNKDMPLPQMEEQLLHIIQNGGSILSPSVARRIVDHFKPLPIETESIQLIDKELWIIHLIADGKTYQEIADQTSMKIDTVRFYIKQVYKKLQVNSKTQMLKQANILNLINLGQ